MKATELLTKQHKEVAKLFKQIKRAQGPAEKEPLFRELAQSLVGHDAIEREIFYPACEEKMGLTDLLGEAMVEHGVVEFSLYEASQSLGQGDFDFKMTVLEEIVSHHVKEEQDDFFPKVERALGAERLRALAVEMEARFAASKGEDYRLGLVANLRKVLAGSIKPMKPKQVALPKRAAAPTRGAKKSARSAALA